jgi:glycosyltransferase involved in cell wall biosynthesis
MWTWRPQDSNRHKSEKNSCLCHLAPIFGEPEFHETRKEMRAVTGSVSVLIPAHNEEEYIGRCIASVLRTGWPREQLEILVIDNCSTDSTAKQAHLAGAEVLRAPAGRIGAVRNIGLSAAKGEFVAYVDGDCEVPPTWLSTAIGLLQSKPNIGAVGGPCLSPANGTWVQRSLAPSQTEGCFVKSARAIATSSFIARTSLLRESGGFDEMLVSGEDDDMSNRIQSRGLTVVSASECHIIHHGYPKTWWDVFKKEIWHGRHHIEVRTKFDLTLVLTFDFILASIALPVLLAATLLAPGLKPPYAFLTCVLTQFAPPFLFTWKRIRQSSRDWQLALPVLAVGYAYFAGHSVGVLANLWQRTMSRRQRPATTADPVR